MTRKDPALPRPEFMARVARLRPEKQLAVWERSAIYIYDAGMDPHEADEKALADVAKVPTQRRLEVA